MHVTSLSELHLNSVHANLRIPVVSCGPPTLEATVQDMAMRICFFADVDDSLLDCEMAGFAIICTGIENRKRPIKQKRDI